MKVRVKRSGDGPEVAPAPAPRPAPEPALQDAQGERHEPTLRLFYALKVPGDVAAELARAQSKLRGNWRAVRADQMHVTLCYLPGVPPGRLGELRRLGDRLTQDLGPMGVRLRGTGYFPNEGSPRVWFVKVEADGLTELAGALRGGVRALDLTPEDQPFKAHITLARKKGPAPRLSPLTFDLGWTAGGAVLYRSVLRKTGPIYESQSTFRFRGAARASPPGDVSAAPPPPPPADLSSPQEQP